MRKKKKLRKKRRTRKKRRKLQRNQRKKKNQKKNLLQNQILALIAFKTSLEHANKREQILFINHNLE